MKAYYYEACTFDGEVYCNECLPDPDSEGVDPIFADSEWDYYPVCCVCGTTHDYVKLTAEGWRYENQQQEN